MLGSPLTFLQHFAHKTNFLRLNIKSNFRPKIRRDDYSGRVIPNEAKLNFGRTLYYVTVDWLTLPYLPNLINIHNFSRFRGLHVSLYL